MSKTRIVYTNCDEDMVEKFSYQQLNQRKVAIRMKNTQNAYYFGGAFVIFWGAYLLYQAHQSTASSSQAWITVSLGFVLVLLGVLMPLFKKWELSLNIRKGIKAADKVEFHRVTLDIEDNRFIWDDGKRQGSTYVTPENRSIIAVENNHYYFISGKGGLDLVVPKKCLNQQQNQALRVCFDLPDNG